MLFADQVYAPEEVDAVLKRNIALKMFVKAHDEFIKSVIKLPGKAWLLLYDLEDCDHDGEIYHTFTKAVLAPKIYTLAGSSPEIDIFGNKTPIGWSYHYWLRMYDNVKNAAEAFMADVGVKNGGNLPALTSAEFMLELANLGICTARLYEGYASVMLWNNVCRGNDGKDRIGYADLMMRGVEMMLHKQTGLPQPEIKVVAPGCTWD